MVPEQREAGRLQRHRCKRPTYRRIDRKHKQCLAWEHPCRMSTCIGFSPTLPPAKTNAMFGVFARGGGSDMHAQSLSRPWRGGPGSAPTSMVAPGPGAFGTPYGTRRGLPPHAKIQQSNGAQRAAAQGAQHTRELRAAGSSRSGSRRASCQPIPSSPREALGRRSGSTRERPSGAAPLALLGRRMSAADAPFEGRWSPRPSERASKAAPAPELRPRPRGDRWWAEGAEGGWRARRAGGGWVAGGTRGVKREAAPAAVCAWPFEATQRTLPDSALATLLLSTPTDARRVCGRPTH